MFKHVVQKLAMFLLCSASYSMLSTSAFSATIKENNLEHDFFSCAFITSEHLTIIQLYQRGFNLNMALDELAGDDENVKQRIESVYAAIEKDGVLNTYSAVNTNYARCATQVAQNRGIPKENTLEYAYYYCAGENKLRFEIILHTDLTYDIDEVLKQTPDTHFDVAINYFKLIETKGLLAAFDYTANNLKSCFLPLK